MLPGARSLHISEKAFLLWTSFGQSCFPLIPAYMAGSTDHGTYLPTLQYKHENQKANSLRMTCTLSLHTLKCLSKDAVNTKPTSLTMDSSLSLQLSARLWGLACVGDIGLMFRKLLLLSPSQPVAALTTGGSISLSSVESCMHCMQYMLRHPWRSERPS